VADLILLNQFFYNLLSANRGHPGQPFASNFNEFKK